MTSGNVERDFDRLLADMDKAIGRARDEGVKAYAWRKERRAWRLLKRVTILRRFRKELAVLQQECRDQQAIVQALSKRNDKELAEEELSACEYLVPVAEFLIRKRKFTAKDCPVQLYGRRNLIHRKPKHDWRPFLDPHRLSNRLFLETNYSRDTGFRLAALLLERWGY